MSPHPPSPDLLSPDALTPGALTPDALTPDASVHALGTPAPYGGVDRHGGVTTRRDIARVALALTAAGAGAIHLALGPEHLREWVVLGAGFYASGVLQLLWAGALVRRESRLLTALGALGSLAFIMVWVVSRTSGLPVGPEAFAPEAAGVADLVCVALEAATMLGAVALLRRPTAGRTPARRHVARALVAAAATVVLGSTGVAVAAPGHAHGSAAPCPARAVPTGVDANHNSADDGVEAFFACQLRHEHDGGHVGYRPQPLR